MTQPFEDTWVIILENSRINKDKKIKLGGIKLSNELMQVNIFGSTVKINRVSVFCRLMAENKINLPFLSVTAISDRMQGSCCVSVEDMGRVKKIVNDHSGLKDIVEYIVPVGSISIFPHQFRLQLLGHMLYIFGQASLPLFGMANSISTLTLTTDYDKLKSASELLKDYFCLGPNHAPIKPEFQVKQIER